METISKLQQEREARGWSLDKVEALTEGVVSRRTLRRWEKKECYPYEKGRTAICKLFDKTAEELEIVKKDPAPPVVKKNHAIIGTGNKVKLVLPQEGIPMSDMMRRALPVSLGSRLFNLIDLWPSHNYHYEELQSEISRIILEWGRAPVSTYSRRQALRDIALVPVQLASGLSLINMDTQKIDTDYVLKRVAAGIAVAWYLRRGKDLAFVHDLASTYIRLLKTLPHRQAEGPGRAVAALLAQCFALKSQLTLYLVGSRQACAYQEEAIRYADLSENAAIQTLAYREMAFFRYHQEDYREALSKAEQAYHTSKNADSIMQSYALSALCYCQATTGSHDEALSSLDRAQALFDPSKLPITIPYSESILSMTQARTHYHVGNYEKAACLTTSSIEAKDASAIGRVQQSIKRAIIEVCRDDQPRDMGLALTYWERGMKGAKELGSLDEEAEASKAFTLIRAAWPAEDRVKNLKKEYQL